MTARQAHSWRSDPALEGIPWRPEEIDLLRSVPKEPGGCLLYVSRYRIWNEERYIFNKLAFKAEKDQEGTPTGIVIGTWHAPLADGRRYRKYYTEVGPEEYALDYIETNDHYQGSDRLRRLRALITECPEVYFVNVRYTTETRPEHRSANGFDVDAHRSADYRRGNVHKLAGKPCMEPDNPLYMKGYTSKTRSPEMVRRTSGAVRVHRGRL